MLEQSFVISTPNSQPQPPQSAGIPAPPSADDEKLKAAWETFKRYRDEERNKLTELEERFAKIKNKFSQKQPPLPLALAALQPPAADSKKRKESSASTDSVAAANSVSAPVKTPSKKVVSESDILINQSINLLRKFFEGKKSHLDMKNPNEVHDTLTSPHYSEMRSMVRTILQFINNNPKHAAVPQLQQWMYIWRVLGYKIEVTLPVKAILSEFPGLDEESAPLHATITGHIILETKDKKCAFTHPLIALYVRLAYIDFPNVMHKFQNEIAKALQQQDLRIGFTLQVADREVRYASLTTHQLYLLIRNRGIKGQFTPFPKALTEPLLHDLFPVLRIENDAKTIINPFLEHFKKDADLKLINHAFYGWSAPWLLTELITPIVMELDHPQTKERLILLSQVLEIVLVNEYAVCNELAEHVETLSALWAHYKIRNPLALKKIRAIKTDLVDNLSAKTNDFESKPLETHELVTPGHYFNSPISHGRQKDWQLRLDQMSTSYFLSLFKETKELEDTISTWSILTHDWNLPLDTLESRYRFLMGFTKDGDKVDGPGLYYPVVEITVDGSPIGLTPKFAFCENLFQQLLEEKERCLEQFDMILPTYLLTHYPKNQLPIVSNECSLGEMFQKGIRGAETEAYSYFTTLPVTWTADIYGTRKITGTLTIADLIAVIRAKGSVDNLFQSYTEEGASARESAPKADQVMEDIPMRVMSPRYIQTAVLNDEENEVFIMGNSAHTQTSSLDVFAPHLSALAHAAVPAAADTTLFPVHGLKNFGNTCYINATMQALLSFKGLESLFNAQPPENWPAKYNDYRDLVKNFVTAYITNNQLEVNLKALKDKLYSLGLNREYTINGQQQDAQGFITLILDCLLYKFNQTITRSHKIENDLFKSSREEQFGMMIVEFVKTGNDYHLSEMIKASMTENIDDPKNKWAYIDDEMKKIRKYTEKYTITKTLTEPPPLLIINLNRLSYDVAEKKAIKITNPVVFDEGDKLDLSAYAPADKNAKYKLIACVTHTNDKTERGHYVAWGSRENGEYLFNDEYAYPNKGEAKKLINTIKPAAYLLFYQREDV